MPIWKSGSDATWETLKSKTEMRGARRPTPEDAWPWWPCAFWNTWSDILRHIAHHTSSGYHGCLNWLRQTLLNVASFFSTASATHQEMNGRAVISRIRRWCLRLETWKKVGWMQCKPGVSLLNHKRTYQRHQLICAVYTVPFNFIHADL